MIRKQAFGLVLVVLGVLATHYVYLHDLIWNRHDGLIYLGVTSIIAVVLALAVTIVGLVLVVRSPRNHG